ISFGTTTKRLTTNHRRNFFRVVYTNKEEAETVAKYIQSLDVQPKQVAGFYNPNSPFSNYFWIEISDRLKQMGIPPYKAFNLADDNFNTQLALKEAKEQGVNVYILLPDGQVTNALSNAIDVIKTDNGNSFIIGGNSIVRPEVTQLKVSPSTNLAASIFWHPLLPQNPQFLQQSQQLWQTNINNGTAVAYDAAIALIEAIKLQTKPSKKGTIAELANPAFLIESGATGSIKFNSPKNGDRQDFYPTLVRLAQCEGKNRFIPISLNEMEIQKLACS
ncbi:MAG: ABC transporter substrate-binding protein, partial [Cyanobacteria bacterium J06649_11]